MRAPLLPRRSERGAVLPSPVVLLTIVAVALAALTFVVTRGNGPQEKDISQQAGAPASVTPTGSGGADDTATATGQPAGTADTTPTSTPTTTTTPTTKPTRKPRVVHRGDVGVVVFNNTSTAGLAASVGAKVAQLGWKFVAADNWYGQVVSTTVYYPRGMRPAAKQLALDLGVQRIMPADISSSMSTTNLTLILTGPLG
jgi:cytoskeletal protein RodZ